MTIFQIQIALTTANLGSISAAAKELNLSQPNTSSYLKSLENELGYKIFERKHSGITTTPKGALFLAHAQRISDELYSISKLNTLQDTIQFRLGISNFASATNSFLKLCQEYQSKELLDFQCTNVSLEIGAKMLFKRELDMLIALNFDKDNSMIENICRDYRLERIFIKKNPTAINLRKGHPLLENKEFIKGNVISYINILKDYPYVYYKHFENKDETLKTYSETELPFKYKILINDTDSRFRLVSTTNAFSLGVQQSRTVQEKYNIVSLPFPKLFLNINCYVRKTDNMRDEYNRYLEILKEELI